MPSVIFYKLTPCEIIYQSSPVVNLSNKITLSNLKGEEGGVVGGKRNVHACGGAV